jgi:hypothetical protein
MLILLHKSEPGTNFIRGTLRWSRFETMVPGWELTPGWYLEESMPKRGPSLSRFLDDLIMILIPGYEFRMIQSEISIAI